MRTVPVPFDPVPFDLSILSRLGTTGVFSSFRVCTEGFRTSPIPPSFASGGVAPCSGPGGMSLVMVPTTELVVAAADLAPSEELEPVCGREGVLAGVLFAVCCERNKNHITK